ncbi:MAG TPA: putative toxin-antitoxin system toxin component, PIN family [Candidatus Kapabacteria bacterium]|nr:putative toxin-antitoxin system toxin component, PIN family [Candidatus Kapabacteria bacterium]HPO62273.1 putative toxin-antitoxin system toxin component, PIN family [Candidatus Kapabacteria bacterium]
MKPKQNFRVITSDPDDNKFIDCAFAAKADYIITGDSHLLNLGSFEKCKIITPFDFLILHNNLENI